MYALLRGKQQGRKTIQSVETETILGIPQSCPAIRRFFDEISAEHISHRSTPQPESCPGARTNGSLSLTIRGRRLSCSWGRVCGHNTGLYSHTCEGSVSPRNERSLWRKFGPDSYTQGDRCRVKSAVKLHSGSQ